MELSKNQVLPISKELRKLLDEILKDWTGYVTLNFRDPNYSAERGGYHPVEIYIDDHGRIMYVTDFSYVGSGPFVELAKELDFDFAMDRFEQMGHGYPLMAGRELFQMWMENFVSYHESGVYQLEVTRG